MSAHERKHQVEEWEDQKQKWARWARPWPTDGVPPYTGAGRVQHTGAAYAMPKSPYFRDDALYQRFNDRIMSAEDWVVLCVADEYSIQWAWLIDISAGWWQNTMRLKSILTLGDLTCQQMMHPRAGAQKPFLSPYLTWLDDTHITLTKRGWVRAAQLQALLERDERDRTTNP